MESGPKAPVGGRGQKAAADPAETSFDLEKIRRLMEENSGG